jgi:hypothetical protein
MVTVDYAEPPFFSELGIFHAGRVNSQDLRKQNLSLRPKRSVGKQCQSFR